MSSNTIVTPLPIQRTPSTDAIAIPITPNTPPVPTMNAIPRATIVAPKIKVAAILSFFHIFCFMDNVLGSLISFLSLSTSPSSSIVMSKGQASSFMPASTNLCSLSFNFSIISLSLSLLSLITGLSS